MRKTSRLFVTLFIVVAIPITVYLLQAGYRFFAGADGIPASLVVNVANERPQETDPWRSLAQGGESNERMLQNVVSEVKAIRPSYIRLDHMYDFYNVVSRNPDGSLSFSFTKLDETVLDILAMGAKPFFSLSYMPAALSKGNELDHPVNWAEWELLVQKTIEHYSGSVGMNLEGIYYEVWNEPDLFGDYKVYGAKNYLELYRHSALGAARAQNTRLFKFGGPATTGYYENWMNGLITFAQENNLWLDFLSWHRYSMDIDDFEQDALLANQVAVENGRVEGLELIISEAGHDSKNHAGYDNQFGAIHTLAISAALADSVTHVFHFEIKDGVGPEKLWGRWGIMTNEKFGTPEKKPRYDAFSFMNTLTGNQLSVSGDGSWVKAMAYKEGDTVRLMVVNYDQTGKHVETVPISFENLPFTTFTYTRRDFQGKSVSKTITADSPSWQTVEYFAANTAAIITLAP